MSNIRTIFPLLTFASIVGCSNVPTSTTPELNFVVSYEEPWMGGMSCSQMFNVRAIPTSDWDNDAQIHFGESIFNSQLENEENRIVNFSLRIEYQITQTLEGYSVDGFVNAQTAATSTPFEHTPFHFEYPQRSSTSVSMGYGGALTISLEPAGWDVMPEKEKVVIAAEQIHSR
ncbi:hypothetical protein P7M58_23205 [Vibrio parahaemolyticus]|nr:hypothetical protein [Vibrio parahaemolyticus]MDG2996872.1 hypothetical protein [Vibrio parahaemolyticus]